MRSEEWRPAAAALEPSSREVGKADCRALRPGREELAVTDPAQMPVTEARHPEPKIATVRAPRGGRPASRDARRLARAWRARQCARPTGASQAPVRLSALRHPLNSGVAKPKLQTPGAKTRRGNEGVLSDVNSFSSSFRPSRDSGEGRHP